MVESILASIMPAIEDMVKKYCAESVEKVAWEVIPDLAENLINKEIEKISRSADEMPLDE